MTENEIKLIAVKMGVEVRVTQFLNSSGEVIKFEITSTCGYRAILPACTCDREPCLKRTCRTHTHCHYGTHRIHVEAMAEAVAKTYGSFKGKAAPASGFAGTKRGSGPKMSESEWRAARGEIEWSEVD